jgi:hypothetical protein
MTSLILSLKLDQFAFDTLEALRKQYFPPAKNFLSAHVTLFHSLPGEEEDSITETLRDLCRQTSPLMLSFPKLRFLGKGVAVEIHSPELIELRQRLAGVWEPWLSAQDKLKLRPHVTIQNKVAGDVARRSYDRLSPAWKTFDGTGEGLLLWHYLDGPWELAGEFPFGNNITSDKIKGDV